MTRATGASASLRRTAASLPPSALILASTLSVQVGASVAGGLLRTYDPSTVVAVRLAFGALLLLLVRPPRVRSTSGHAWRSALALGAVLAVMNSCFYIAISRIPLGVAVTIEFIGPLAAAVVGSRRPLDLAWVAFAGVGIWILAGGRLESADAIGVAAAGIAGIGWFLYIQIGGRVGRDWPDGRGLTASMAVAALLVTPVAIAGGELGSVVADPRVLLIGAAIGIFSSVLPYTLEIAALGRLRPATFGILMSIEPAIAAVLGFVLLGQPLGLDEVLAIGLVIVASAGSSLTARALPDLPGELGA